MGARKNRNNEQNGHFQRYFILYVGLFEYATEYLKPLGYLVFLYPVYENENFQNTVEELPSHSNFELLDYSINKLAKGNIRILITMRRREKA